MTRKTDRRAEDLYDSYADGRGSGHHARRLARQAPGRLTARAGHRSAAGQCAGGQAASGQPISQ